MANFTIERAGKDEKAFRDVFALLLQLHKIGGLFPLDVKQATANVWTWMQEGMTFLARGNDGAAIGVLILSREEPYYSRQPFLISRDFFVKPDHRGKPGVALLRAAGAEADRLGLMCFVQIDNPDRRAKGTMMTLMAQEAGYAPLGYMLKLRG